MPTHGQPSKSSLSRRSARFVRMPEQLLLDRRLDKAPKALTLFAILWQIVEFGGDEAPSLPVLTRLLGCARSVTCTTLDLLIETGWVIRTSGGGSYRNHYELLEEPDTDVIIPTIREALVAAGCGGTQSGVPDYPPSGVPDCALYTKEVVQEVLQRAVPAEPRGARSKQERPARTRTKINAQPDANGGSHSSGRDEGGEPVLGADPAKPPVDHRPNRGPWLAAYFLRETDKAFADQKLPPGQINHRALIKTLKDWIDSGKLDAQQIKAMIDVFCIDARPVKGLPLWRGFIATKDKLFIHAQEYLVSATPTKDRYRVPPPPEPKLAMQYLVK